MSSSIDARDRQILEHLHQATGGDVQSLCDVLGVTRTAIRQRIGRLESAGFRRWGPREQALRRVSARVRGGLPGRATQRADPAGA